MTSFLPQEFIRQIRDGEKPADMEIQKFISGIGDNSVNNAQIAAFTMAVFFNDLAMPQRIALTKAMRDSGDVLSWPELDGPVLDKHSSGGIGDNVSLILGPLIAACGGYVPMISGRGLGHTGGTLDKFDAIPGYSTTPTNEQFRKTVKQIGCAIIGQTGNLAPADKKIYSIRSATASVENISLITASILSKKLAAGLQGLVLDIKCGNGAFMADHTAARELATSLVTVANGAGVKTSALITDMNEPLASCAGNSLEVINAINHFKGVQRDERLHKIISQLSCEMLLHANLAVSQSQANEKIDHAFSSGNAAEKFAQMVTSLGGPNDLMQAPGKYLQAAPIIRDIKAPNKGVVSAINTRDIGLAVIVLGGGRKRPDDKIDYAVGFDNLAGLGAKLEKGEVIARVHARSENTLNEATKILLNAYEFGSGASSNPLIIERIGE